MNIQYKLSIIFAALVLAAVFRPAPEINAENSNIPAFSAYIEYSSQGYIVKGIFTEFTPDISQIQPLYSLDGETYHTCGIEWDLRSLGSEDSDKLAKLQNQICLYHSYEPLKNYLEGEIDRFYLKLRLTHKNGTTLETKPAVIDRGAPQPLPEDMNPIAKFASSMSVRKTRPFLYYGKYQITVNTGMTPEEISAYLPDTLPIEVQLQKGIDHFKEGIVECPVTWKPLSLPTLNAGESITISDAAEEIVVPAGTLLHTPMGIFQLEEPIGIHEYALSDEVKLVLNIAAEDGNPTGVLTMENTGLELSFELKPTGATAIRAYIFTENGTEWSELPKLPLLKSINAQPATPNSSYTLVLKKDQEPLRSYLGAKNAQDTPIPFFVGLKIESGVYDGRQLVLTWPENYDLPQQLPELGGAGGNENNAGAGNKEDGTLEGQRPTLPKPSEKPAENPTEAPSDKVSGHAEQPDQKMEDNIPDIFNFFLPLPFFTQALNHSTDNTHPPNAFPYPPPTGNVPQNGIVEAKTLPSEITKTETTAPPAHKEQAETFKRTGTRETSDSPTDSEQHTTVQAVSATITAAIHIAGICIAGTCIIGICIFALTGRKKSRQKSHKC